MKIDRMEERLIKWRRSHVSILMQELLRKSLSRKKKDEWIWVNDKAQS